MKIGSEGQECKINDVAITNDTLSSRGGISFILRDLDTIGLPKMIGQHSGYLRKSLKGETIGACTRDSLLVTGVEPVSEFLDDLRQCGTLCKKKC